MRHKRLIELTGVVLALFLLALVPGPASGATYDLCAGVVTKTIDPDGAAGPELPVNTTMWGFGLEDLTATCESASVPGPVLEVGGPGDPTPDTLTINLRNTLPEATSLHILGQQFSTAPTPTFVDGRVMSFTHEAASNGPTATYTWGTAANPFRHGTYMLQSGTDPAKQVQMGLYLAVKKDFGPGEAYPGVLYDKEQIVVFSEIDPEISGAIAVGTYGPGGTITSSVFYHPRYFLINGEVFAAGGALDPINRTPPLTGPPDPIISSAGERVLLRFVNAGLETHVPQILGLYMTSVAEDGNPYLYAKEEYGFELAAAKTKDAIIQPTGPGPVDDKYPLYDARLNMNNMGNSPGGMLAYLLVSSSAVAPVANADAYGVDEDGTLDTIAQALPGVLDNDTAADGITLLPVPPATANLVSDVSNGTLALNSADGSFTYTPDPDFNGVDTFTYQVNDGTYDSNVATVTITVNPQNDPPVANDDSATTEQDPAVVIDVLANDTDADGDALTISGWIDGTNGGVVVVAGPQLQYTPNPGFTGQDTFTYTANDGTVDSNVATVTVEVTAPPANQPPVAVDDYATVVRNSSNNLINVVNNDFDPDGTIDTTTLTIISTPLNGTAVVLANGVVSYTPNPKFKGADSFSYRVSDDNVPPAESLRDTPTGLSDEPTVVFINVVIK